MSRVNFRKKGEVKAKPQAQRTTAADVVGKAADKPVATAPAPVAAAAVEKAAPASPTAQQMTADATKAATKAGDKPVLSGSPAQQEQQKGLVERFTNGVNEKLKQQGLDTGISVQSAANALSGAGVTVGRSGVEVPAKAIGDATALVLAPYADKVDVQAIVTEMRQIDDRLTDEIRASARRVDHATAGALRLLAQEASQPLSRLPALGRRVRAKTPGSALTLPLEIVAQIILVLARNQVAASIAAGRLDEALLLRPSSTHADSFVGDILDALPPEVADAFQTLDILVVR